MQSLSFQDAHGRVAVNAFIRSVYNWMAMGLGLTGFMAYGVSGNQAIMQLIFGNQAIFFGLIIGELILVFYMSSRINKLAASTATALFLFYAMLNGVTLSVIFLVYAKATITSTFFVCSATFVGCSLYGMTTKRDLTSLGGFMAMGLIGIIIASVVNIFVGSSSISMMISYIGVFVFVGLTAYDTQALKAMALSGDYDRDESVARKGAIIGALKLYLDFINMFLFLLRILGSGRD